MRGVGEGPGGCGLLGRSGATCGRVGEKGMATSLTAMLTTMVAAAALLDLALRRVFALVALVENAER